MLFDVADWSSCDIRERVHLGARTDCVRITSPSASGLTTQLTSLGLRAVCDEELRDLCMSSAIGRPVNSRKLPWAHMYTGWRRERIHAKLC
jgi:hypothetical protein